MIEIGGKKIWEVSYVCGAIADFKISQDFKNPVVRAQL